MDDDFEIARVAALIAEPARARIAWALIDGTMRPAGELAYAANVSAPSASAHLAKLVHGGLLRTEAQGRHRYFRLASAEVASVLEGMASLGTATRPRLPRPPGPGHAPSAQYLYARTCYGHLAGEVAVRVLAGMLKGKWLVPQGRDFALTPLGERTLASLGVDVALARRARRVFARACVDLTQRRQHLGGALGEALLAACVANGWVERHRRSRVVTVTPKGNDSLRRWLGA